MFPFLDHPGPIAFAHRGGGLESPENTLVAFEHARALGYKYIETDAVVTRDGVLLAFHDERLDNLTDRRGAVHELPWSSVQTARVHGTQAIPKLEELLGDWPDACFNIEPKHDTAVAPLAEAIRRTNSLDRVCIGSFSTARIRHAQALLGERLCTSDGPGGVARLRLASVGIPVRVPQVPCMQVPVRYYGVPVVDRLFVRRAQAQGMKVHVWTIDSESEMHRLLDLGVDGLMTDSPTLLKDVLVQRGQWVS